MRNIKKLLTLTSLFLVLFSFPVSAAAVTDSEKDSEKFHFQLEIDHVDDLLPGDLSDHTILVHNNTDKRLAYRVEAVTFTGSEALAEVLELSILDGERCFLHGSIATLSQRQTFETILCQAAKEEKLLTLRLHLRKEASNTVAGHTLTLSIHLFGTDAPVQESTLPEETEEASGTEPATEEERIHETTTHPPSTGAQDVKNANDGRPSGGSQGTGGGRGGGSFVRGEGYDAKQEALRAEDPPMLMDQLMEWIERIRDHRVPMVETAESPYGEEEADMISADGATGPSASSSPRRDEQRSYGRTRKKAAAVSEQRAAEKSTGETEEEMKKGTGNSDAGNNRGNERLRLHIVDVHSKQADIQIRTEGGQGTVQDPVMLYIGPTAREKVVLILFLFLMIALLLLIILKCWLLYRATQMEDQEDRVYVSAEQNISKG